METAEFTLVTTDVETTRELGAFLAQWLGPGDVVALFGDLGTGKTAFAQGIARGLGVSSLVTSPTFTLINQYRHPGGLLQHVDCYRLSQAPLEMWDAGLVDLFDGEEIILIEWADRLESLLPAEHLAINFAYVDESRRQLSFRGRGARFSHLVRALAAR